MSETTKTVFLAPGQGSLRTGLDKLAEKIPEVGESYALADEISIEVFGPKKIEGKNLSEWSATATQEDLFGNTIIAQPLLIATTIGLIKYLKKSEQGTTAYGHSLGELAALYAAGSIDERDAIGVAMLRGVYSHEASQQNPGIMAALMNVPHDFMDKIRFGEEHGMEISTSNSPDQITVSGYKERIESVISEVKEQYQSVRGLTKEERRQLPNAVRLKIAGGFHSFLMRPAQKKYRDLLEVTPITMPTEMNYFSNYSHDYEGSPEKIRHHLVEQLVNPVDFWQDIGRLVTDGHLRIIEVGPGKPLSPELKNQQAKGNFPSNVEIVSFEADVLREVA